MSAVEKAKPISVEDYLAGELISSVKHEYVDGYVYAMSGGTNAHSAIAANITIRLGGQLHGKRCRPFTSATKILIPLPTRTRAYYPDLSIVCDRNPATDSFQSAPVVIVEVLSKSTRDFDDDEKREDYLSLPSLKVLLHVEQDRPLVRLWRRRQDGSDFDVEIYEGLDAIIGLPEIEASLPLADVYEAIEFMPEITKAVVNPKEEPTDAAT